MDVIDNPLADSRDHESLQTTTPNKRDSQPTKDNHPEKCKQLKNKNEDYTRPSIDIDIQVKEESPKDGNGRSCKENSNEGLSQSPKRRNSLFSSSKDKDSVGSFQFHQIPLPNLGSRFAVGGNLQSRTQNTFLERFRSQTSIPDYIASNNSTSSNNNAKLFRNGSSLSVLTSPIDAQQPPSPTSGRGSFAETNGCGPGSNFSHSTSNGQGPRASKPKKWYSFANLLNRQNISSLLNLPKSRLSVSSTLNSVFTGPTSPNPSGSENYSDSGTIFFGGFNNFSFGDERSSTTSSGRGRPDPMNNPGSPTPSCATVAGGDYPYRYPFSENISGQVVYRRKKAGGRSERNSSASATSSVVFGPGGNVNNISSGKHYSSGGSSGCGGGATGSECASERSSGIGYYTGCSSGGSSTGGGVTGGGNHIGSLGSGGGCGGSRLSCGEFFTGTPNSPICSGDTPTSRTEFQFNSGHSSSGFGSRDRDREGTRSFPSSAAAAAAFYSYHKNLGRSLPTLLESMETGNSPSPDGGNSHITVDSVVDLIYQEFAVLTGSKTVDDHYIMIFPDRGNFHLLSDEDYKRLMSYLTSVPPMHDAESGFVLIIDRRNDKWNSVKSMLIRISSYFPGLIHRVFVLRPVGFLQKALSEVSTKLFRTENLRFRITVCNHVSDLSAFVDPSQLTTDLGGYLYYDRAKWVQQRVEVEAFHLALQSLSRDLKLFTESFIDFEYPNDVTSTDLLLTNKHSDFERLRIDLSQAGEHGESLLSRIKKSSSSHSLMDEGDATTTGKNGDLKVLKSSKLSSKSSSSVQLINVISVERFIIQIEETTRLFDEFWIKEKKCLEQCLRLRRFEHEFRDIQATFDFNLKTLNGLGEMGETLGATDVLIAETLAFEISSSDDVNRALQLERGGRELVETNPSAVDSVEPKCLELTRITLDFRNLLKGKINKQRKWREVQAVLEKANHLCTEGMDLVTAPIPDPAEEIPGVGWIGNSLINLIDEFLDKIKLAGEDLTVLKTTMNSPTNSQSKPLVKQVLKRVEDVQLMCIKRKALVMQHLSKSRRSSGSNLLNVHQNSISSNNSNVNGFELKPAKSTSQLDSNVEEYSSPSLKSGSSTLSLDGSNLINQKVNRKEEDWEQRRTKRGHVLNELLQTERTYVEEIGEILMEYREQMHKPEHKSLLPQQLKGKSDAGTPNASVLFCNIDEIHAFHSAVFLPDLSNCVESVELVGLCFIQRHSDFLAMYSQYCQLLPASEALRKQIGENHPWFITCRNRLGHKLPLGAYLLKPVQRITKYHLLLKDLVKSSEGCVGFPELVEALECMLVVLRCVNDGMHQLGITGYPGKLIDEGYLLLQNSFLMWTENKKDRLRLKGHQRHLFLYQRSILICKKIPKSSSYEFRNQLSLSEVGLTEALKGSGASKKFEIWVNARQKIFLLQAESQDIKELWVREIKKLLLEQLESLRAMKSQTIGACGAGFNPAKILANETTTGLSNLFPAAALRRQQMMAGKGVTMNGWRSTNLGHRPLRQATSWDNSNAEPSRPKSRNTECDIEEEFWSSEVSNSDDDEFPSPFPTVPGIPNRSNGSTTIYGVGENVENGPKFIALADYGAIGPAEVPLKEGDIVTQVKVGCGGWWFVKVLYSSSGSGIGSEGWAPQAYLESWSGVVQQSLSSCSSSSLELQPITASTNSTSTSSTSSALALKQNEQQLQYAMSRSPITMITRRNIPTHESKT